MGFEQGPEYYDTNIARCMRPLEESPWQPLYLVAASFLPPPESCDTIVDLGCGTGRFARLLADRGYTRYQGVDFSALRVAEARRYVPSFHFDVKNLLDSTVHDMTRRHSLFVVLEVLEHIQRDLDLLAALPAGSHVILSVPSYDSKGHVRTFSGAGEVEARYGGLLDFRDDAKSVIERRPGRKIFVFAGKRKPSSSMASLSAEGVRGSISPN